MFFKWALLGVGLLCVVCEVSTTPRGAACPTLKLKYGRVRYRQKGRFVKFMCNPGYLIAGEKYSTCHNGAWDSPVPKCVRASCVKVNPPINGLIYPSHRGAVLNFFCKPGYELRGPNTTYCDGRTWDSHLPACIESNTKPSLSCDFESEDLCGWNHDLRHDFDWIRMNHETPSGHFGTGPHYDHTKGEGENGYYMYTESSSRNENDTARLISPIYDKMPDKDVCLEFYYHMYGATMGQLRIYLKKVSEDWALDPNKALFWSGRNHGDDWFRSLHRIGSIDEDFQIIIEGVRGSSYFSDIAVDDVRIFENCTIDEDVTTESELVSTSFETFESCLNRCDDNYGTVSPSTNSFQYSCACDETCIDNNTCCLDYIAVCVLGPTDDDSTTSVYTTTMESSTTEKEIEVVTTTVENVMSTTIRPSPAVPKKNKTTQINSNDVKFAVPKTKPANNNPPFKKYNPANATNFNRNPAPFVPRINKPPLIFLTPSTPEVIVQKLKVDALPTLSTTAQTPRVRTKTIISQIQTKKPPVISLSPKVFDDIATVPPNTDDDRTFFTAGRMSTVGVGVDSEPSSITNYKVLQNQKIVKEKPQTNTKFVIVVIASVSFILLSVVSVVVLVRRYKAFGCRKMKRHGMSSDSQSDVRFLTSDEMLDFNLACPDD